MSKDVLKPGLEHQLGSAADFSDVRHMTPDELRELAKKKEEEQQAAARPGNIVVADAGVPVIDQGVVQQNHSLSSEAAQGELAHPLAAKALEQLINEGGLDIDDPKGVNAIAKKYLGSNS